ncbi:sensor histidine kinase [Acidicapsa acidisoli]|uniref:sensor histidine kinase n=1 Tax=Acidicapsa acidisoli TaxID=1615681 RepID=UPI0021E03982|nr:ATP-binding protein [Acidicapsa acidisoli]
MKQVRVAKVRQVFAYSAVGILALGALTYTGYLFHLNLATAGFLCLIVLVLLSSFGDMISATVNSVVAVACLDYFFAPPILSLRVSDPLNMLALATFLATSLGITFQVTRVRREKILSDLQRKELKRLYELAQQLLALKPEEIDPPHLLTLFRDVFSLRAICLFEHKTAAFFIVGDPRYDLEARTRMGHLTGEDSDDSLCRISIRCLRVTGADAGTMGFEWPDSDEFTPDSLSKLETTMLRRVQAYHDASQAAADERAQSLRIMLLDALAHAVKTPLATVLAATGGLRMTDRLTPDQAEFVDVIEAETSRLGSLTTRLLRTATLDQEELRPRLQLVDVPELIAEELSLKSQQFVDHRLSFVDQRECVENGCVDLAGVPADPELLRLALEQLIENACKYSPSGSTVEVSTGALGDTLAIRVRSRSQVPLEEHSKIFDRFYRGKRSHEATPGTGLGLDIARKIALAHGGNLVLEDSKEDQSIFRITIPVASKER